MSPIPKMKQGKAGGSAITRGAKPVKRPLPGTLVPGEAAAGTGNHRLERITQAAIRCFVKKGISGTTMDDVADESGIARPNLYRYVQTRQDLIRLVVVQRSNVFIQKKFDAGVGWRQTLAHFLVHIVSNARADEIISLVHQQAASDASALVESNLEMIHALDAVLAPLLATARASGSLRDDLTEDEILKWINFQAMSLTKSNVYVTRGQLEWAVNELVIAAIVKTSPLFRHP
jgi:AcrR family transcriptional regulator